MRAGRLYPRFRGVFSLLPTVPLEGAFLAAVKACGPGAVLSHFAAAVLWCLLKWDYRDPEVTAPTPRVHSGIRTHRSANVERVIHKGIPVTPPLRTLTDLAATPLPDKQLRRAVNEALNQRLIKPHEIITSHHRGAKRLRALLETAVPDPQRVRGRRERAARGPADGAESTRLRTATSRTSCGPSTS